MYPHLIGTYKTLPTLVINYPYNYVLPKLIYCTSFESPPFQTNVVCCSSSSSSFSHEPSPQIIPVIKSDVVKKSIDTNHVDDFSITNNDAISTYNFPIRNTIKVGTPWIYSILPHPLVAFAQMARIHIPIGNYLILLPTTWSIALAMDSMNILDIKIITLLALTSFLTRSGGCVINDIIDQDIDAKVIRTKSRPIPSGRITTVEALITYGFLITLCLLISFPLNNFSWNLIAFNQVLGFIYPFMKRWTYWPQAFLGIAMNWGIFSSWVAIKGVINLRAILPIYISGCCWTLIYDTIYAHMDKEDDVKVGVKSTALLFGDDSKIWLWGFTISIAILLCVCGIVNNLGYSYYAGALIALTHLAWQITTVDLNNPNDCRLKFISNKWYGTILLISIILGKVL